MNNNSRVFAIALAGLILLPGCMRVPSYQPRSLQSMSGDFTYRGVEKGVVLQAKRLTEDEMQFLFGQQEKSFTAIYFSIHNLSNASYVLSTSEIDCKKMSYQQIARQMKTSSIARLAGSAVSGYGVYGGVWALVFGAFAKSAIFAYGGLGLAVISIGMVPIFLGTGIKSAIMNTRIRKDLEEKMISKDIVIKSGDKYEGLIFVNTEDYRSDFTVTLHENNNQSNNIIFNVDLSSGEYLIH